MKATTLDIDNFRYINRHLKMPVPELVKNTGASESDVLSVLKLAGVEPDYWNGTPNQDGRKYTIRQAIEATGKTYEFFNDAIMAGEITAERPETASGSY